MRRVAAVAALLVLAVAPAASAKHVRIFAVGPKFSLDWVDTAAHYHGKLLALADARLRSRPGTPPIQRDAADVASHLLGPSDPAQPVATARDLVTMPEDLGLMAAFTGSRGALARTAPDLTTAILGLIAGYSPVSAYYAAKYPSLLARPFPPTRLLAVSLTDTFVSTAVETFAELAQRLHAYVVAGVVLAQDWRVVCDSKAAYKPPPGAGPCAEENPALVALLRSPDEPTRTYAYEATTDKPSTMALVFDPDGRLIAKTVKAYLTPTELPGQLDLVPGEVSGVSAIQTPVGRLGIVTSKDAWMPDITAKLDAEHTEILIQPEFFVNDTIRTGGPWAPDNIEGAGFSDLLRDPSIQALALPQLVGNVFDFSSDSQMAIAVKPRSRAKASLGLLGQVPMPGLAAVSRWVVPDSVTPAETIAQRRQRLGRAGEALLPTSGTACSDPAVAGPCKGGQVEDVIAADANIGPRSLRRSRQQATGPEPFTASRPLAPGGGPQRNVALAMHGRSVLAAYEQSDRVYAVRSGDGGRHWSRPRPVTADAPGPQWWPSVSIGADGAGYVAWQDGEAVRFARALADRTPAGAPRFSAANLLAASPARQWRPSIALTAPGHAVIAWVYERSRFSGDDLPQAGIYAARIDGASAGAPQRLDRADAVDPLAATLDNAWAPSVASRGGHVLVSWIDFRTYAWNAEARESADGGATFGAERQVNHTPAGSEALEDTPRSAITANGTPLVAYTDWFKDNASNVRPSRLYDIELAGLSDAPVQVDGHGGAPVSTFAPDLATIGSAALVAWQDHAIGPGRIFAARVGAGGRVGRPLRVDDSGMPVAAGRARPAVAAAGGRAIVAWEDERDGPPQIYTARVKTSRLR